MQCGVVKIMPLGDSITEGIADETQNGGYRGPLYQRILDAGFTIDFVGEATPLANIPDPEWEGHSGFRADQIGTIVFDRLIKNPPDVVLLHIGTNDIDQKEKATEARLAIEQILEEIDRYERFSKTTVTVILAKIIINPRSRALTSETVKLNGLIDLMAVARIAAGDSLVLADFESALSSEDFDAAHTIIHPNASGYSKMASVWFDALNRVLLKKIKGWQGPAAFGGNHLQPGGFITPLFRQSDASGTSCGNMKLRPMGECPAASFGQTPLNLKSPSQKSPAHRYTTPATVAVLRQVRRPLLERPRPEHRRLSQGRSRTQCHRHQLRPAAWLSRRHLQPEELAFLRKVFRPLLGRRSELQGDVSAGRNGARLHRR
jgi:hypothetical protein